MTLLETTYTNLHSVGLVACAEAFSADYLGKNRNWYAFQKHAGRDFSLAAAIQCLRSVRLTQHSAQLPQQQHATLQQLEQQLLAHLTAQHSVADVC